MKSAVHSTVIILLAIMTVAAIGCRKLKKDKSGTVTSSTTVTGQEVPAVGGKGGEAAIKAIPNHGGLDIDSCMIYIKYNSAVISADGTYDDSTWAVMENGRPVATFSGLLPDKYYLFGKGWDIIRSQKVRGGLFYTVEKDNNFTTHTFVVPVMQY